MISFIVGYKNMLKVRKEVTEEFFEMMDKHLSLNRSLECIISDYGSDDGVKEILESYDNLTYVYVKPNPNQYLNLPKCYNKAVSIARNDIIGSIGPDMRFKQKVIDGVIEMFKIMGDIILRVLCLKLNKEGVVEKLTYSPYFIPRSNIIMAGGYDERMFNWGKDMEFIHTSLKEDDDILERLYRFQGLTEIRIRNLNYIHLWHDESFANQSDNSNWSQNHNASIMMQNIENGGINVKNSYWKIEND